MLGIMKEYILDGLKINSLDEFYIEFANMVHGRSDLGKNFGEPGYFGKNFHAFDDCMFGGFGLANPCRIIWTNSVRSRKILGHSCYYKYCDDAINNKDYLDEDGLEYLKEDRDLAAQSKGQTMFDALTDAIKTVEERSDGRNKIELILK